MIFNKKNKYSRKIKSFKPWFHNLHLPNKQQTAPDHFLGDFPKFKWEEFQLFIPKDLTGWKVLDIGCNAGFYSFEFAKRGADVTGIDFDPHFLEQAKWASKIYKLDKKVQFRHMQVYDLVDLNDKFDLVIFMGIFYHLRYPLLALDIITQKAKKMLVFQTLTMPGRNGLEIPEDINMNERDMMLKDEYPKMAFIEGKLAGDPTNWWAPNHSAISAIMRTCGFTLTSNPGHEIYIFERDKNLKPVYETWNSSEFLSAVGRNWKKELKKKAGM